MRRMGKREEFQNMLSPTGEAIQWKERAAEKGHGRNDEVGQQRLIRMGFDMQSKRYGKA